MYFLYSCGIHLELEVKHAVTKVTTTDDVTVSSAVLLMQSGLSMGYFWLLNECDKLFITPVEFTCMFRLPQARIQMFSRGHFKTDGSL